MHVSELFDYEKLQQHLDDRLVSARRHPILPLTIWNYTDAAQYGWDFDEVLVQCRGLVTDDNGRVVARPFDKFFSADQPGHAEIDLDEWVYVTDKADGSLIIYTFDQEYGPIVSSRGSFESDQAIAAGEMLQGAKTYTGVSFMFELVGPSNRIVLEYPEDELILLGGRIIDNGKIIDAWVASKVLDWQGKRIREFSYGSIRELLQQPDRESAEGYVIYTLDGRMLKHKFDAYVDLHRIIFGMNERTVWEKMAEGQNLEEILLGLPDEIHGFVNETYAQLLGQFSEIWITVEKDFDRAPRGVDRKTFAEYAKSQKYPALLFSLLDGRDIGPQIWKMIYPKVVA